MRHAVLFLLLGAAAAQHNFTDCGSEGLVPTGMWFDPDPLDFGKWWKIGFTATPKFPIQNGTMTIEVTHNGKPGGHSFNICKGGAEHDGFPKCPFAEQIKVVDVNPPFFSRGLYKGHFTMWTGK